ncbi:MAG TPA: translocation/assembly module TamB domain-containing protein [Steroidobacteraceae bacterium]|nr:translocation/assembly module TamB domain-containing protein [Steroidobacteraceae bacterium]
MKRVAKWLGLTLVVVVILVAGLVAWGVNTQAGARSIARIAVDALGGKLALGGIDGTIAGPLTVSDLRYRDPEAGIDARLQHISLDLVLADVLHALVHIRAIEARGIDIALHEPTKPPEPKPSKPFSLKPPIDVAIDSLVVDSARVRRDDAVLVELTRAIFDGRWTSRELAVKKLDVRSPQGEIQFSGTARQRAIYSGEGRGRFRWKAGERLYTGELETYTQGSDAKAVLKMSAPLTLELQAQVTQKATWPWRFTLEAPRFDPRAELLPDSSLTSLAASLSGHGSLDEGAISGKVLIDDEPLLIEPLRFTRKDKNVAIDTILRISRAEGALHIGGDLDFGREPLTAKVAADWKDIVVPAQWAGQELHTHGTLKARGSAEAYSAQGTLALGPAEHIADITLDVQGSPQRVDLKQLDVSQAGGRLAMHGRIDLQPQLGWDVSATARDFDPGAFAAAWRGRLGFDLASSGKMLQEGPQAKLTLTDLRGELRGRPLSGNADVSIAPKFVATGTAALNSGKSQLRFRGRGSGNDDLDATLSLNVASLNDWVPDSGGRLQAQFVVRGKWPDLSVNGNARGSELHAASMRIESLNMQADVDDPRNPHGSMRLDLTKLTAAGFEFDSVHARAGGTQQAHRFGLRVNGQPLALELDLQGARTDQGWAGSLQNLVINVKDAARLALREPANIVLGKGAAEISQTCLVDNRIELCAAGALQPDGGVRASYSLANVPLALGNALATSELPIKLDGTLQGHGEIRRSPQGELFGDALIESDSGSISRQLAAVPGDETQEPPQKLLGYRGLRISATLSGPDARAAFDTQLEPNATLHAEANVRDLGQAQTPLAGTVRGQIPDLAPLAVFAPQLANVHGRVDADIALAGTVQAPQISGLVSAADLAADIPAVGLKLKDGQLQARPAPSGEITVDGRIQSGDGRLAFNGKADRSGRIDMHVGGERVLAADIPGARVLVTPDLNLVRTAERMSVSGQVTIPEATINLQKLPRGGEKAQAASSDVIVVDEQSRETQAQKAPVYAEITVNVGDKVDLTGFGLQANVQGRLDVRESPGQPTLGSGEMRVAGKYKAYGQDLTIQRGQLLYAWTPLDNPRLNIEATRTIDDQQGAEAVTAGLRIRGSARTPELTVFSDPPMSQANALSYLVAGKPIDQIGAGDSDASMMQTAARSIGVAGGGLLAKSIGKRLGVDELSVKEDEMVGGAALTVGEYLSPRLYLSYGVGLFEPGDVITLRYKLSDELALQTQRGPDDTRAGIEYRIER